MMVYHKQPNHTKNKKFQNKQEIDYESTCQNETLMRSRKHRTILGFEGGLTWKARRES